MKRLCLFAAYDASAKIQNYVKFYIEKMSELADVYYLADCEMKDEELNKIRPHVKQAWAYRHGKYDFGSWQELIFELGWDFIFEYDEVIFCNDSCFGPLYPLKKVFSQMESKDVDFWGITQNTYQDIVHLQSYFLVFSKKVVESSVFKFFIESIKQEKDNMAVIYNYELKLTKLLEENGFQWESYINPDNYHYTISEYSTLNNKDASYYWRQSLLQGHPFLKVKLFTDFLYAPFVESLYNYQNLIKKHTKYNVELINNLLFVKNIQQLNSIQYLLKMFFRKIKEKRKVKKWQKTI